MSFIIQYRSMQFYLAQKKEIQTFLKQFFKVKKQALSKQYDWGADAITRLQDFVLPGKMVRGGLVVLSAMPKSTSAKQDAIAVGAALELMHSGILIHDDIMDQDKTRRGLPTVFAQYEMVAKKHGLVDGRRYGESMGACAGIIAYFFAVEIIANLNNKKALPELMHLFGSEMAALGLAQMMDVDGGYHRVSFSEKSIRKLYEQKTGRYTFTLPLLAGRVLSGEKAGQADLYDKLGKELGMVFQLQDDLLSLTGNPKDTGKAIGSDILERKQTLPYLRLLQKCDKQERAVLQRIYQTKKISPHQVKHVLSLMEKHGVFKWSSELVQKHQQTALSLVQQLKADKFIKLQLEQLLEFLISRNK